jgi:hypothetical protein
MSQAIAAERARPMVRRDHLTHGPANAGAQTTAAEQQIRDERQEPSIDDCRECLHGRRLGAPSAGVLWPSRQFERT